MQEVFADIAPSRGVRREFPSAAAKSPQYAPNADSMQPARIRENS